MAHKHSPRNTRNTRTKEQPGPRNFSAFSVYFVCSVVKYARMRDCDSSKRNPLLGGVGVGETLISIMSNVLLILAQRCRDLIFRLSSAALREIQKNRYCSSEAIRSCRNFRSLTHFLPRSGYGAYRLRRIGSWKGGKNQHIKKC